MKSMSDNVNKTIYKWSVVAHFFSKPTDQWLDDFIKNDHLVFKKIYAPNNIENWHTKKSKITSLSSWKGHMMQTFKAFTPDVFGIITSFPPLAMCAALIKLLLNKNTKIIAYNFNLGAFPTGFKQKITQ